MNALLLRVKNILIRPGREWQAIKEEPATYSGIIFRYVAVLAALPPAAAAAGRFLFDRNIQEDKVAFSLTYFLLADLLWYCMYVLNVMITGAIIAAIASSTRERLNGLQGLKIAAYSFTPLCIAGFFAVVPKMGWIVFPAIIYSVYLLYLGLICLATMEKKQALWRTAVSFFSSSIIIGVMNLFEYYFESIVVAKIVF
jgi:hypothetical protein